MSVNRVDLGFLEKCEPWLLINTFFPSKVGGRPAWLDVESTPEIDRLNCNECGKQLAFLCQVIIKFNKSLKDQFIVNVQNMLNMLLLFDFRCMLHSMNMKFVSTERSMSSFVPIHFAGNQMYRGE